MGAETFENSIGKSEGVQTAQEAWEEVHSNALYMKGHGGYTGTIAEKDSFEQRNDGKPVATSALREWIDEDGRDNDKWGPAYMVTVCMSEIDQTVIGWAFYGSASS